MLVLLSTTAVLLALAALALGTASRLGAVRALAALLGVNALLVARAALVATEAAPWARAPWALVAALALFALSPPLLALSVRRTATGGPLRRTDARAGLPALVALVALGGLAALRGGEAPVFSASLLWAYLLALNGVAVASFVGAARTLPTLDERIRLGAGAVVGAFGVHWTWSTASWVAALIGGRGAAVFEALSVGTLLAFGLGAAWWGLRRLPSALPTPLPPPDPDAEAADDRLAARVRTRLVDEAAYLDPELTVDALAASLREPTRDVSRVLNARLGGGFHDVVGGLRVAEAQRLLRAEPTATVLDVLHRAGFNSKSAFHRAFRQHAGTTPSAYRAGASGDGVGEVLPQVSGRIRDPEARS